MTVSMTTTCCARCSGGPLACRCRLRRAFRQEFSSSLRHGDRADFDAASAEFSLLAARTGQEAPGSCRSRRSHPALSVDPTTGRLNGPASYEEERDVVVRTDHAACRRPRSTRSERPSTSGRRPPRASGPLGEAPSVADRDNPGRYSIIVFFDSYEDAMKNSALPETDALAEKTAALADGPPTFVNLDIIEERLV